jgi:mannose/fructose/N-acetylgalactosamine-specific phosphotransferase system component IID
MKDFLIKPGENLLDPKLDPIFKAIFTSSNPESKGALKNFLTVFIGKKVKEVSIISNESAIKQQNEKQVRYDFSCKFNDGKFATVEMALRTCLLSP